jgi:hypothetical protein
MASAAATKTLRFLTATQIQRLHAAWVNPNAQPTQPIMLDSAVQSPINIKYYTNQQNVFQLAAKPLRKDYEESRLPGWKQTHSACSGRYVPEN